MKECPICKKQIADWEALCNECWKRAEEGYRRSVSEKVEVVERLKGQAKNDLLDLMREICRSCPKFSKEVDDSCTTCVFKEKEKLIRAFLE